MTLHTLTIEYLDAQGQLQRREQLSGTAFTLRVQEGSLLSGKLNQPSATAETATSPTRLSQLWQRLPPWGWALGLLVLYAALQAGELWIKHNPDDGDQNYVALAATLLGAIAAWAALWAILGKVFSKATHYWRHVCWLLACGVAAHLLQVGMHFLSYSLAWHALGSMDKLTLVATAALLIWGHLIIIVPSTRARTLRWSTWAIAGLVLGLLMWNNNRRHDSLLDTLHSPYVYSPSVQLSRPQTLDTFFQHAQGLETQLKDKAKVIEPGEDNINNDD